MTNDEASMLGDEENLPFRAASACQRVVLEHGVQARVKDEHLNGKECDVVPG